MHSTTMSSRQQANRCETTVGTADILGSEALIRRRKLGLICSQKCPGDVILKAYDVARLVRGSGLALVSGFHSPIERDCLSILLRGSDPIIIVQAHKLSTSRLPMEWQSAVDAGRLLLLSPFGKKEKRVTKELATKRNRFVASIADEVLIPYAAPGSKTEALALEFLGAGKCVYTFDSGASTSLSSQGAVVMSAESLSSHCKAGFRSAKLTDAAYNKS
jgi:predicted Rossmann fold nucleotide-binding protein DprA/Smf involved in DNA uptake